MPYKNWDHNKNIAGTLEIYRVNDVVTNLKMLRHDIINRQVGVDSMRYTQMNLYLITGDRRVSNDEYFVCSGIGSWSLYLDKLILSVRSLLDTLFSGQRGEITVDMFISKTKDLEDQSVQHIHKIFELFYNLDGVLTQFTLEKKFSLEWIEEPADQKSLCKILEKPTERRKSSKVLQQLIEDEVYQSFQKG